MKDVCRVVWNEWRQIVRNKKAYGVLVVGVLLLCAIATISYIGNNEKKVASHTSKLFTDFERRVLEAEEELRNWNPNLASYEDKKKEVEKLRESYETSVQATTNEWRMALGKRKQEAMSHVREFPEGEDALKREIAEIDFYLKYDAKPLGDYGTSAYDQLMYENRNVVMVFLPLLVLAFVAIIVTNQVAASTSISPVKVLIGKWFASISIAFFYSLAFYAFLWLMLGGLYGFSTGMFEPRWANLDSIEEVVMYPDGTERLVPWPIYDGGTILPNWLFTLYMVLLSSGVMILIATMAFACTLLFRKPAMGIVISGMILGIGSIINYSIWEAEHKMWLFTNHLNLIEHVSSRQNQPSIAIGIAILMTWLLIIVIPALYISSKRRLSLI